MLLTSSDAPVYSDASGLIDNTDEISRYDFSTARVSTVILEIALTNMH